MEFANNLGYDQNQGGPLWGLFGGSNIWDAWAEYGLSNNIEGLDNFEGYVPEKYLNSYDDITNRPYDPERDRDVFFWFE